MLRHNTPQRLSNRLSCLPSDLPGYVLPIILSLQQNARGTISEVHRMYGTAVCLAYVISI